MVAGVVGSVDGATEKDPDDVGISSEPSVGLYIACQSSLASKIWSSEMIILTGRMLGCSLRSAQSRISRAQYQMTRQMHTRKRQDSCPL